MCLLFKTSHLDTKLNADTKEKSKFLDKLEFWLFLKSHTSEKDILPPLDDFVINPMRESNEVIIGEHSIFY